MGAAGPPSQLPPSGRGAMSEGLATPLCRGSAGPPHGPPPNGHGESFSAPKLLHGAKSCLEMHRAV
eukprot:4394344-Alexandrium_andersonii.AAC.1